MTREEDLKYDDLISFVLPVLTSSSDIGVQVFCQTKQRLNMICKDMQAT